MSQLVIVTGPILRTQTRSGVKRVEGEEPRSWEITTAYVLVEDSGVCEVVLGRDVSVPIKGELVYYLAEVSVYQSRPQVQAIEDRSSVVEHLQSA